MELEKRFTDIVNGWVVGLDRTENFLYRIDDFDVEDLVESLLKGLEAHKNRTFNL
ncbi:MAG: hypothetical protein ACFFG0_03495 [Candidatus Thorarchaeota archaeon]